MGDISADRCVAVRRSCDSTSDAPTRGNVLLSEVLSSAVPTCSVLQFTVHALAYRWIILCPSLSGLIEISSETQRSIKLELTSPPSLLRGPGTDVVNTIDDYNFALIVSL